MNNYYSFALLRPHLWRRSLLQTRSKPVIASVVSKADSMMDTQRRSAAREAFEAMALAKNPTSALLHRACSAFVDMVAEIEQQRVTLVIGQTVIAREHERRKTDSDRRREGVA